MGGDHGPKVVVPAALEAAAEFADIEDEFPDNDAIPKERGGSEINLYFLEGDEFGARKALRILEAGVLEDRFSREKFQFQTGAIKRIVYIDDRGVAFEFQFQTGAIRRCSPEGEDHRRCRVSIPNWCD